MALDPEEGLISGELKVDPKNNKYPYCLVWTPIPILTWILPFVGHLGIATSYGTIYDFAGPYYINSGRLTFGNPTRYYQLDPSKVFDESWDTAIQKGNDIYSNRMHILCWDNCHSHVGCCLTRMKYSNTHSWNMVKLAFLMFLFGKYTSFGGVIKTWLPFCIIVLIVTLLCIFL